MSAALGGGACMEGAAAAPRLVAGGGSVAADGDAPFAVEDALCCVPTTGFLVTACAFASFGAKRARALQYNLPRPMSHGALVLVASRSFDTADLDFLSSASFASNCLTAIAWSRLALSCAACISHTVIS